MNLKTRLATRSTATVKFTSDTTCIYSDECSLTHVGALSIMTAETKIDLWHAVCDRAIAEAAATKFKPIINVITPDDILSVVKL